MKYIFLTIVTMISLLCSCALEETFEPSDIPEVTQEYPGYFILSGGSYRTKVTYSGDAMSSYFQDGELLGAFALDQDVVPLTGRPINACYKVVVTEETHLETGEKIRILEPNSENDDLRKDGEGIPAYYMFYYPYDSSVQSLDDLKQYEHSVAINQNSREEFQASDLLWDITSPAQDITGTAEYVWVEMDHAMAQIIVEIESDLIQEGTVPTLLNMPITVSPINLVKSSLDEMTADMGKSDSYILGEETADINMWGFGYATSGNLMFRAAIPANHLISYGSAILQITAPDGTVKSYRTSKPFDIKPGMTYRMTLVSQREVIGPGEVGDDDTWVYDVLDPETMQPVGLLCREYVRFQPGVVASNKYEYATGVGYDRSTGTAVANDSPDTKYANAQAWVFYKMQSNEVVPDLTSGQVLYFLYDVWFDPHKNMYSNKYDSEGHVIGVDAHITNTAFYWPEPHINTTGAGGSAGGLFTPLHGHRWVAVNGSEGITGQTYQLGITPEFGQPMYGYIDSSPLIVENDMHGGVISWGKETGNDHYTIIDYSLPTSDVKKDRTIITNQIANDFGHIAITDDEAYVSYEDPSTTNHKIGLLVPRYLVDRRVGKNRTVEERLYPIVKIGYNQFWMSLSLRAATLNDGTPIQNFNSETPGSSTYRYGTDAAKQGFMYYSSSEQSYNPYYDMTMAEREEKKLSVLYNFASVSSDAILPLALYGDHCDYYVANTQSLHNIHNYLGVYPHAKLMTRRAKTRVDNKYNDGKMSWNESYALGAYSGEHVGWYMANICGFDLRVDGAFWGHGFYSIGGQALMWCLDDKTTPKYYSISGTDVFYETPKVVLINNGDVNHFMPIRFFMKFKGQADSDPVINVTSTSLSKGLRTKSSAEPVKSRDVYVSLEPVEE